MLHLHDAPQHGLFGTSLWLFKRGFDALVVAYGGGRRVRSANGAMILLTSPVTLHTATAPDRVVRPTPIGPVKRASARRRISIRSPR